MARFIARRLLLALVTLWLLATIVFVITNVLPDDVGRTILGPFAPQETVDALNEQLGTNRPLPSGTSSPSQGIVTLDFGDSFVPASPSCRRSLGGGRALGQAGRSGAADHDPDQHPAGLYAARRRDRQADRAIVLLGVTLVVDPRVRHRHDPRGRRRRPARLAAGPGDPPPDADILTQIRYLLMPAIAMAIVYFGYIARMTRAGTIEVLQSDYTRTATMKGLTTRQTMRRHVLRNALVPTVAVIAVQIGYLFGGIIAVEKIFNYNGMGATMLFAAQRKDLPDADGRRASSSASSTCWRRSPPT